MELAGFNSQASTRSKLTGLLRSASSKAVRYSSFQPGMVDDGSGVAVSGTSNMAVVVFLGGKLGEETTSHSWSSVEMEGHDDEGGLLNGA